MDESLPAPAPSAIESFHRKRKHATAFSETSPSPAPQLLPTLAEDEDPNSSRPRLTISRHPSFTPVGDFYNTDLIPANRVGYRYSPAGLTEPGATLLQRTIECAPTTARVSWYDRSPFIKVSLDGLSLAGDKGFRSARFNTPLREGKWFFEVRILQGNGDIGDGTEGAHVRLGFARREAPLNGPAGLDGYSYGIRDKTGEKVHISRPKPYAKPFGTGDVVGMYICLPPKRDPDPNDPEDPAHLRRERIAIEFKGQEYFESLEYPQEKEMMVLMEPKKKEKAGESSSKSSGPLNGSPTKKSATVKNTPGNSRKTTNRRGTSSANAPKTIPTRPLSTLDDSYIAFFINGECQGIAFQDLYSYLPLRKQASTTNKRSNNSNNPEAIREHKVNHFDDGSLGYYPMISLFNDAKVRVNTGPDFEFYPEDDIDAVVRCVGIKSEDEHNRTRTWRPLHERYPEYMAEQWALDEKEEAEATAAVNSGLDTVADVPKWSREKGGSNAPAPARAKRSRAKAKPRVKQRKDAGDRRSESVYGERADSMTPAGMEGREVYTPGIDGREVYTPGIDERNVYTPNDDRNVYTPSFDGRDVYTPNIGEHELIGPGVIPASFSIPHSNSGYAATYSSPDAAVPDYVSEPGEPSDMEGGDSMGWVQTEIYDDVEFEHAAS